MKNEVVDEWQPSGCSARTSVFFSLGPRPQGDGWTGVSEAQAMPGFLLSHVLSGSQARLLCCELRDSRQGPSLVHDCPSPAWP